MLIILQAKTMVAPLDRVKILFQASNPEFKQYAGTWSGAFKAIQQINSTSGIAGLFQGHSATLLRVFPYAAIKFLAYDRVHFYLMPTRADETNVKRFFAGASSGTLSVLLTYPLELIRVRMAYQTQSTSRHAFINAVRAIYVEGNEQPVRTSPGSHTIQRPSSLFAIFPISKFYRGFSVTLLGMIPYAGTSFLVWGALRAALLPPPPQSQPGSNPTKPRHRPIADLSIGAVSGVIAQTVSYPFEVVRRRLQVGGLIRPRGFVGWGETVQGIWATQGWRGFFIGLSIGYVKVVPMTAVSFMCWEAGKRLLGV
ncbi:hypothetical protein FS749_011027 [Ceratobasidium sp. UAMH 11750]|nr:hypothetical protein FS749_011027 [Ceratobasidium sp. UAMH 11750]